MEDTQLKQLNNTASSIFFLLAFCFIAQLLQWIVLVQILDAIKGAR